ncbi:hypothetical protein PLICRDRAFT_452566 [Plicaturopsis crispa FD-325 SS-3]|uniref:F-box domain-containing protein n=1 Tax=Plicaturopsis crispa FD-325 SS-3 TaxID=944288 RepID=A0A0C9SQ71_PLICR|nr:hypothetical protein PLICRDRAFT_452566 [Plicaturopsis crispa FD-325 SS-3]
MSEDLDSDGSQELLNSVGQAISRLQEKQSQLKRELEQVELSLAHKRIQFSQLKNENVRVARLPPEILSMIFEAGNHLDPPYADGRQKIWCLSTRMPVLPFRSAVSSVSTHWRAVALRVESLWRAVRIRGTVNIDLAILDAILARSGAAGLSLTFVGSDGTPPTRSLMNLICTHIQRWESFALQMGTMDILHDVLGWLRHAYAPRLRDFSVSSRCAIGARLLVQPMPIFQGGAPSLRALVYNCVSPRYVVPPYHAITSLDLGTQRKLMTFDEFRSTLNHFACLEELIIRDNCALAWPAAHTYPATLPCLRSICIAPDDFLSPHGTTLPLAFIRAPLLDTVAFSNLLEFDRGFFDAMRHGLAYTPCRLPAVRTMSVSYCQWEDDNAEGIMEVFPRLSHIILNEFNPRDSPCHPLLRSSEGVPLGLDVQKITFKTALLPTHVRKLHELLEDRSRKGVLVPIICFTGQAMSRMSSDSLDLLKSVVTVIEEDEFISLF